MWMSGVLQGLMWRAINADGTLTYSFVESLEASKPFYLLRFFGGVIVLSGMLIMAYNVYKTIRSESENESESEIEVKTNVPDAQTA
jgi:cytochrome c oxidase cbb3-type subunit 1